MKNIIKGSHFWALMDNELIILIKDYSSLYYCCGAWEGSINEMDFEFISYIKKPENHKETKLCYG